MNRSGDSRLLPTLLLGLCVAGAIAHAVSYGHVTSDDAFISLRYARNLAEGRGLVFNPGGQRVEGFSNPVFTLISAALIRFGVAPLATAKWIGLTSWTLLILVCARFGGDLRRDDAAAGVVSALLLASSTFAAVWAVAGLETMLHALLVTVGVWSVWRECEGESESERPHWSPFVFLLVTASRPEGALLAAAAAAAELVALRRHALAVVRSWTVVFALPVAVLLAARYAYFDALVPNTFGAKVFLGWETVLYGLDYVGGFVRDGGIWVAALAVAGFVVTARAGTHGRVGAGCIGAVIAVQLAFVIVVGGDAMLAYRFLMPVYPLLVVLAAVAIVAGIGRLGMPATLVVALVVSCASMAHQIRGLERSSRRYWLVHERPSSHYLFGENLEGTWLAAHAACARYIREHASPDDVLAVTEAGVIPFDTGLDAVDLLGLNDRTIANMWQNSAREERESKVTGAPSSREWSYDVAQRAYGRSPRWIVLDGHFDGASGGFVPRLGIGSWMISHTAFSDYREVFRARVYDGQKTGLGPDRFDVVFERRDTN